MSSSAAIPSGRVPPSGLGISTRRTGGARYAPPLCRRRCRSSRRSSRPSPYISHVMPSTPAAASRFNAWNARCSASGVMWWKSAVRRSFGFLSAAFRIRLAACGTLARRWVRRVLWQSGFPLVEALSSGASAEARAPLFAALTGRMASSDFFKPFIIGFGFLHSLRDPATTCGAV